VEGESTLDGPLGDDREAGRVDVDQIGLKNRDAAQDHVDRRQKHFAESVAADMLRPQHVKIADDHLVARTRRGIHEQLALVQLVPAAVVRQSGVVVVGQDHSRRHR